MTEHHPLPIIHQVLEYLITTRGTASTAEAIAEELQYPLPPVQAALDTLAAGFFIDRLKKKAGNGTYLIPN